MNGIAYPALSILTGLLLWSLLAWEGIHSLQTGTRFGRIGAAPRLARDTAPAAYWSSMILFGIVMGRSGFKFIEVGLVQLLAP